MVLNHQGGASNNVPLETRPPQPVRPVGWQLLQSWGTWCSSEPGGAGGGGITTSAHTDTVDGIHKYSGNILYSSLMRLYVRQELHIGYLAGEIDPIDGVLRSPLITGPPVEVKRPPSVGASTRASGQG